MRVWLNLAYAIEIDVTIKRRQLMHHRYDHINIPIEILRSLIRVAECGSLSKAGAELSLSQPAISAQIRRLQTIVGDHVFRRTQSGIVMTELGMLVLAHARKILEANDQILALAGGTSRSLPIRIGIPPYFAEDFFEVWRGLDRPVSFMCVHSTELERNLVDGHLDVACILNPIRPSFEVVADWSEDFRWSRARDFKMSPGNPVPVVTSLNAPHQQPAVHALERSKLSYRIAFSSNDCAGRLAAVANCVGVAAMPVRRRIQEPLTLANDYYLPKLDPMRVGICLRSGVDLNDIKPVVDSLTELAPGSTRAKAGNSAGTTSSNVTGMCRPGAA